MQTFQGIVVSAKTPQTLAVELSHFQKHPKYLKIIKKTTRLLIHNELPGIREGDIVSFVKSRPYSKNKHFKAVEILSKAKRQEISTEPEKKEPVIRKTSHVRKSTKK